jgi:uncharacterized protein (DUF2062 family)
MGPFGISRVKVRAALVRAFMPWREVGISGRGWRHNLMYLLTCAPTPRVASRSVAMGVFTGILPIYGFQLAFLTVMTPVLRLHWPLAFLGVNVSCAPLLPFVVAAAVGVGRIVVPLLPFTLHPFLWTSTLAKYGVEWFAGSLVLAVCSGILAYGISFPVFRKLATRKASRPGL